MSERGKFHIHGAHGGLTRREFLAGAAAGLSSGYLELAFPQAAMARPVNDRVIVIGAGISGLAAARRLADRYRFTKPGQLIVLEARNRIGGRIETDRDLGFPVDEGAVWIHGASRNPLRKLAEAAGAQLETTDYD